MPDTDGQESRLLAELKDHFDIVAEALGSKIQLIAEGVVNIDEKLDRRFDVLATSVEKAAENARRDVPGQTFFGWRSVAGKPGVVQPKNV